MHDSLFKLVTAKGHLASIIDLNNAPVSNKTGIYIFVSLKLSRSMYVLWLITIPNKPSKVASINYVINNSKENIFLFIMFL